MCVKAQAIFDFLSEAHSCHSKEDECLCKGCAWLSLDAKHASLPFVLSGLPCGVRKCAFKRYVEEIVDVFAIQIGVKQDVSGSGVQQKTLTFDARHLEALNACVELAGSYGLYPYDLLVVPSANMLCQGKGVHLPKPNDFVAKSGRPGELWRGKMVKFLKDAFQAKKEQDTYRGYREDNLRRIAGLWIWDRVFEAGIDDSTSFHEKIKPLFDEAWYKETYLGDNTVRQLARVENKRLDVKAIVEQHRNYYITVDQEIRHGRLLSERLAKKMKKEAGLKGKA